MLHVVAMGVSATGKSSVAKDMAEELGYTFIEGDNFHPPANIRRMADGIPLSDEDRLPWLQTLAGLLAKHHAEGISTILTCSALRRSYRDVLRGAVPDGDVFFVHLHAEFAVLQERMSERDKHFMPTSLLESQFDTLEELQDDEAGVVIDVEPPLDRVVAQAVKAVRAHSG